MSVETVSKVLADEGWCCDPYGHEDGPPAPGECSECDRMRDDTAAAIVAALKPGARSDVACTECTGMGLEVALNGRVTGDCRVCKGTGVES